MNVSQQSNSHDTISESDQIVSVEIYENPKESKENSCLAEVPSAIEKYQNQQEINDGQQLCTLNVPKLQEDFDKIRSIEQMTTISD